LTSNFHNKVRVDYVNLCGIEENNYCVSVLITEQKKAIYDKNLFIANRNLHSVK